MLELPNGQLKAVQMQQAALQQLFIQTAQQVFVKRMSDNTLACADEMATFAFKAAQAFMKELTHGK